LKVDNDDKVDRVDVTSGGRLTRNEIYFLYPR